MRLYIKQKVITWRDTFHVYDENGDVVFKVKGELISIGHKLHLYDAKGVEKLEIKEKLIKLLPAYKIEVVDGEHYELVKKITLLESQYKLKDLDWVIDGGILEHNYEIKKKRKTIASVHQKWLSIGDSYCIEILDEDVDPAIVVAVMIAIDCIELDKHKEDDEKDKKKHKKQDKEKLK